MIIPDRAPTLRLDLIPAQEQGHARYIESGLNGLQTHCANFRAAIALLDHCEAMMADAPDFQYQMRWEQMAMKEAASVIYQFNETIESLGHNIGKCPTVMKLMDKKSKKIATKLFSGSFPGFEGVRHSGQHAGEFFGTPENLADHTSGSVVIINCSHGRILETMYEQKTVSLAVTMESLARLISVRNHYWQAFKPLDLFGILV